jgi:ribonuclease III
MKKVDPEQVQKDNSQRVALLFALDPTSAAFIAATTHPSFSHESPGEPDNQRLEFLGDAILDFLVSEDLYERYKEYNEGQLTRLRAQLVSTQALSRFARHHDLGAALRFGKGAGQGSLHDSENVLADVVEALIAASYVDQGVEGARRLCRMVSEFGTQFSEQPDALDAKSDLQERVQALGLRAPIYRVVGTKGPAHEVVFDVEVSVGGVALAQGRGRSKRLAERAAAELALNERKYEALVSVPAAAEDV